MSLEITSPERLRRLVSATKRLKLLEEKKRLEDSLIDFHKAAWEHFDPAPYVHGRHLDAIAEHLEAVAYGEIRKLLINVAPRHSKSLLISVSFPAWLWAREREPEYPLIGPQVKLLCLSYGDDLALDLAIIHRRLVLSDWYQERWGSRVKLCADQEAKSKFDTTAGGTRISASFRGGVTGRGGDIKIIDDPIKAGEETSEITRRRVLDLYDGTLKSRVTDPKTSAEIIVMQRLHPEDLSGHVLDDDESVDISDPTRVVHLCLPEIFESERRCATPIISYGSGRHYGQPWEDWREKDGELLWPERFGERELSPYKRDAYQWAAQWQQRPEIKGGGILKREYWQLWDKPEYPKCDYILACLDPAYTEKEELDPSGFTIWGAFLTEEGERAAILMFAFRKWLGIHGPQIPREADESKEDYRRRAKPNWGLVETVHDACERFRVNHLIIENKASGISVAQSMAKLMPNAKYKITSIDPRKLDKTARMHLVQPEFSGGQIYAPDTTWAEMVISECAVAPKGVHDDLLDSTTYSVYYLRAMGLLERREEQFIRKEEMGRQYRQPKPLYNI